jgi:lysophospholipase L1-like esterase
MVRRIQDSVKSSKNLVLFLCLLASISFTSCKAEEDKVLKKTFPYPLIITAFGASIVQGDKENNYEDLLQLKLTQALDSTVIVHNRGIAGQTTRDGLNRIRKVLKETNPEYILITLGTNDALRARTSPSILAGTYANMDSIIFLCLQHNTKPILSSLTGIVPSMYDADLSKNLQLINSAYWQIAQKYKIPFLDLFTPLHGQYQFFAADGIHLNAKGYQLVSNEWYKIIMN